MAINDHPPAERQPRFGETIVHCGHITGDKPPPAKFFRASRAVPFKRPNGSINQSHWFVCCLSCWSACCGDWKRLVWRGDGTWRTKEPVVRESIDNRTNLIDGAIDTGRSTGIL